MLPVPSSLTRKESGCTSGPCSLELEQLNNSTSHLFARGISTDHERNIILAVIFGVVGSIVVLFLIYYIGRHYLSRQSNPASTDLIIEQPIDISSPLPQKQDYPPTPTTPFKSAQPSPNLPDTAETAAFLINHPYGHPYAVRDTTSMSMPPSTLGAASTVDSSSLGPVSVQSMAHPYSSSQRHRGVQYSRRDDSGHSQQAYNNDNSDDTQQRTTMIPTVDESQQYESFMSPDTPRSLSFKELRSSLASPDTAEPPDSSTAATATSETSTSAAAERRSRAGIGTVPPTAAVTTTSTLKLTYPPSVGTHDTVHSEDTLPSMYSYTSTSGPVPIQELHFPQSHLPSRSQFRQ